jgi:NTP pyrophosphatase (non-canonical NTP hydrolase)
MPEKTEQEKTQALTFADLRAANVSRAAKWNAGADVPILFRAVELAEEVGEVMGAIKKIHRLQQGMKGGKDMRENLIEELGDVVICADLLAEPLGINLGEAVAAKFNATSEKHGFPDRLPLPHSPNIYGVSNASEQPHVANRFALPHPQPPGVVDLQPLRRAFNRAKGTPHVLYDSDNKPCMALSWLYVIKEAETLLNSPPAAPKTTTPFKVGDLVQLKDEPDPDGPFTVLQVTDGECLIVRGMAERMRVRFDLLTKVPSPPGDSPTAAAQTPVTTTPEALLRHIAQTYCGVTIDGEITLDMVPSFVEGEIEKQAERASKLEDTVHRLNELLTLGVNAAGSFLKACRCVDIHHHGFGPAFDAAVKFRKEAGVKDTPQPSPQSDSPTAGTHGFPFRPFQCKHRDCYRLPDGTCGDCGQMIGKMDKSTPAASEQADVGGGR